MKIFLCAIITVFLAMPVSAQVTELPEYAYEALAEISMITTAQTNCEGARVNERRLQGAMTDFMTKLASDGVDPVVAIQFMETDTGKAEIAARDAALRERHGVDAEGYPAFCSAVKAELKVNKDLAKIVKLR